MSNQMYGKEPKEGQIEHLEQWMTRRRIGEDLYDFEALAKAVASQPPQPCIDRQLGT